MTHDNVYDLLVIGGGPGGLSAALNAGTEGYSTLVLERQPSLGGQIKHTARIENYMGFTSISGPALIERARKQAKKFGVHVHHDELARITPAGAELYASTVSGMTLAARAIVYAAGMEWRKLACGNVDALLNRGVYYGGSVNDAVTFTDKTVVVVGAANSAGQAAQHLSRYARRVIMLVRGDDLGQSMSAYLSRRVKRNPKIKVMYGTEAKCAKGADNNTCLESVDIAGVGMSEISRIGCEGMFICIGSDPAVEPIRANVELNERGFVVTGRDYSTSLPGLYAIGDVRDGIAKRVSSAMGDGAAVISVVGRRLAAMPKMFKLAPVVIIGADATKNPESFAATL